jgi:hypothetical protein
VCSIAWMVPVMPIAAGIGFSLMQLLCAVTSCVPPVRYLLMTQ